MLYCHDGQHMIKEDEGGLPTSPGRRWRLDGLTTALMLEPNVDWSLIWNRRRADEHDRPWGMCWLEIQRGCVFCV